MTFTIVIPQHGRAELTRRCIASIRKEESRNWPIIVVDDGSPADDLADFGELVSVIRQPHGGVTAAWNAGLQRVETQFVIFLNNDVEADGPFVERLLEPLMAGDASMTGPALRRERMLPRELMRHLPTDVFVEGWCFAVECELLRRFGGFDEAMRLYWSDTDLQLRLHGVRGRSNSPLLAVSGLPLRHIGHATTRGLRDRRRQWLRDREVFLRKWSSESGEWSGAKASRVASARGWRDSASSTLASSRRLIASHEYINNSNAGRTD